VRLDQRKTGQPCAWQYRRDSPPGPALHRRDTGDVRCRPQATCARTTFVSSEGAPRARPARQRGRPRRSRSRGTRARWAYARAPAARALRTHAAPSSAAPAPRRPRRPRRTRRRASAGPAAIREGGQGRFGDRLECSSGRPPVTRARPLSAAGMLLCRMHACWGVAANASSVTAAKPRCNPRPQWPHQTRGYNSEQRAGSIQPPRRMHHATKHRLSYPDALTGPHLQVVQHRVQRLLRNAALGARGVPIEPIRHTLWYPVRRTTS